MWHFERFDHCRSLRNYQDNYTDCLVRTDTKCGLKMSGMSYDGRLLFTGL